MSIPLSLAPGSLATATEAALARARRAGALEPVRTEGCEVADGGVRFQVRRAESLVARELARRASGPAGDPFADPDPALCVMELGATHRCLLNRFPVLDRHLLLVTRAFVSQEAPLDASDWAVLGACLAQLDGLGFYNGGAIAGASQPHKHLQLVPLPLGGGPGPALPIEPWLAAASGRGLQMLPGPPFDHAFAAFEPDGWADPSRVAARLHAQADAALARIGVTTRDTPDGPRQSRPYNLLVTRRWLLAVPRVREAWQGISINALGFAGSLFVRDAEQLERLRRAGPLAALRAVAAPRS